MELTIIYKKLKNNIFPKNGIPMRFAENNKKKIVSKL